MSPKDKANQTLTNIRADVALRLDKLPPEKRDVKVKSAKVWWGVSTLCFGTALAFIAGGFYVAVTKEMTVVLAGLLGGFIIVPLVGAIFAAHQASGEATRAALGAIVTFGRGARGAIKGGNAGATDGNDA